MAIVIKGNFPHNCDECDYKLSCPVRFEAREDKAKRHPNCPIIGEIPDKHGDLVELQEVEDMLCEESSSSDRDVRPEQLLGLLKGIPVILEASK